ncbi:phage tail protein [Arcobacter sp. YIC-310]|uniref:phage tail protein n=1 Tax=Arcobacter sp. YIC-310 TaxID=3376632 RepID=UPI003C1F548B
MAEPILGEIKIVPYSFAPRGFTNCEGQVLPISENTALFSLVGTTYGGDGRTNFAVPNFKGKTPMHWGTGPGLTPRFLGEFGGYDLVTLAPAHLPEHTHEIHFAFDSSDETNPIDKYLGFANAVAGNIPVNIYSTTATENNIEPMSSAALALRGGGQSHENRQPFQVLRYVIALIGIYPSRN